MTRSTISRCAGIAASCASVGLASCNTSGVITNYVEPVWAVIRLLYALLGTIEGRAAWTWTLGLEWLGGRATRIEMLQPHLPLPVRDVGIEVLRMRLDVCELLIITTRKQ